MTTLRKMLGLVESAVLAPVYRDADGEIRRVLIVRGPRGIHGDQIALPGGKREDEDADLLATALREADEEIGLDPRTVEVLTELPLVETMATGFRITPYLGRLLTTPTAWRPQEEEVAEVLDIRVRDLLQPEVHDEERWQLPGWPEPRPVAFYRIGPLLIWGVFFCFV